MREKITVIIPSHERHQLLQRAIDYYSELDLFVLIVDSSELFLNVKLPENITYLHLPGSLFGDKIYSGLCNAITTYSCLCADDDFLAESGLKAGEKFLEENLDYVSVQGHYIQFDPSFPKEQNNPLYHRDMIGYINDSDLIKNRTLDALKVPDALYSPDTEIPLHLAQKKIVPLFRMMLERPDKALDKKEIYQQLGALEDKQTETAQEIEKKYGQGSINLETGEFTKN